MSKPLQTCTFRLPRHMVKRIDALARDPRPLLIDPARRAVQNQLSRSEVVRAALLVGLDFYHDEKPIELIGDDPCLPSTTGRPQTPLPPASD